MALFCMGEVGCFVRRDGVMVRGVQQHQHLLQQQQQHLHQHHHHPNTTEDEVEQYLRVKKEHIYDDEELDEVMATKPSKEAFLTGCGEIARRVGMVGEEGAGARSGARRESTAMGGEGVGKTSPHVSFAI